MAEAEWLLTGLIIGVLIGIPISFIIIHLLKPREHPASVIFTRDQEGRITEIHYIPTGGKT